MSSASALVGWYYKRGGQRIGPLPSAEVVRLLDCGALAPSEKLIEIGPLHAEAGPGIQFAYVEAASVAQRAVTSQAPINVVSA